MFSNWQFRAIFFLLKLFGFITFKYPSNHFKRTKYGICILLVNISLFLYLFYSIAFSRKYDFIKKFNVVHIVSLLLTISMFTTRFITISLFFGFNREIFKLLKRIKKFDLVLQFNGIKVSDESNLPAMVFIIRVVLTFYIFGKKPISVISLIFLYIPVDFYFFIVMGLIKRLHEMEYFMR